MILYGSTAHAICTTAVLNKPEIKHIPALAVRIFNT